MDVGRLTVYHRKVAVKQTSKSLLSQIKKILTLTDDLFESHG